MWAKETWFTWRVYNDFGTLDHSDSGGGEKGRKRSIRGDVLWSEGYRESWTNFLKFGCEKLNKSIHWWVSWMFVLKNSDLALLKILLYWWTYCMYCDLLKVDFFLCQMHSYKCLISFATIMLLFTHPVQCLDMFGVRLSIFGNQAWQGWVIFAVQKHRLPL